jgi:hypothetical protein
MCTSSMQTDSIQEQRDIDVIKCEETFTTLLFGVPPWAGNHSPARCRNQNEEQHMLSLVDQKYFHF